MSTLLEKASLVMIPSGYKEDVVYSEIPTSGAGDLSFTRASNGTRINSAGLVEDCPWNLFEQSETFNNAPWVQNNCTISSNVITAPNGTTTADKLVEDTTTSIHRISQAPGSINGVFSAYAKAGERTKVAINTSPVDVGFDLVNGTVINLGYGTTGASIESVGNGWWRISLYLGVANSTYYLGLLNSANQQNYTGDGTSGAYIWGAQLNIGSTAKPYFPTTDRLNVPRLTYQNGGGGCPSLLLEKQSTNLTLYSEQLDNAVHNNIGFTITANNIASPDGTQNADKFTETTVTDEHIIYDIDSNATGTYTLSAFFKGGAGTIFPVLRLNGADSAQYAGCIFNTSTGAVVNTFYNTYSAPTTKVENMGNGWYRVSMTTTTTNTNFGMRIASSNSASPSVGAYGAISYTGSTSNYFYAYGAQLEASSYSTSYIPTTSSSATRVADACFKTGISSLIGQTSGTMFVDFEITNAGGNQAMIITSSAGNEVNRLQIYFNSSLQVGAYRGDASVNFVSGAYSVGQRIKAAVRYKLNDYAFYVNGVQIGTDTSASIPPTPIVVYLGTYVDQVISNSIKINQSAIFAELTNAELASLTTI